MPDAVDMLNEGEEKREAINSYKYLIDLTGDAAFAAEHSNIVGIEELEGLLREELPCTVDGLHWFVNECLDGGYYLTVFNNIGIERSVTYGEKKIPEATRTARVSFKDGRKPEVLEGDGELNLKGDDYLLTLPAGGYAFIRFV